MSLLQTPLKSITEETLTGLIANRVHESDTLEYKGKLLLGSDEDKREFLADITSFTNAQQQGGDIIYGMETTNGLPDRLIGLAKFSEDNERARIENILRDSVQTRPSGVKMRVIPLDNGNHALIIRVLPDGDEPHMISHKGFTRFCIRNSNGKNDMDIHQLRSAFRGETVDEKIEKMRADRVSNLANGDTPRPLTSKHLIVLHIFPYSSFVQNISLSPREIEKQLGVNAPSTFEATGLSFAHNADGWYTYSNMGSFDNIYGTCQIFRKGFIEVIDSCYLSHINAIPLNAIVDLIMKQPRRYFNALQRLGLNPPYKAGLSLINIKGLAASLTQQQQIFRHSSPPPYNKPHLLTDLIRIDSTQGNLEPLMRPIFVQLYDNFGMHYAEPRSQHGEDPIADE